MVFRALQSGVLFTAILQKRRTSHRPYSIERFSVVYDRAPHENEKIKTECLKKIPELIVTVNEFKLESH